MGEQTKADVVSIRVTDGNRVEIEGLSLDVAYTPGHTDDSYSYLMPDRVFTGDTLLIRGTGRTDFQNGDPRAQYESLFGRLLKLPDETLVYPAHDYKGDTVSTIGEERAFNPRLQVKSMEDYVLLMNSLNLPNPKMMDVAVPANMRGGLAQKIVADRGWALTAEETKGILNQSDIALVDLREAQERKRDGVIPGSLHVTYPNVRASLQADGLLQQLARSSGKRLIFYCSFGWRSAMAVQAAQAAGLEGSRHIDGGLQAWKKAEGPLIKS
jgi:sulfur dioxygenase